jgi:uncharacterized protein (DUF4415 family)
MKKARTVELTPELQRQLQTAAEIQDTDIDLTDMPEDHDWSAARRGPSHLYRPLKEAVTIRLDADVLHWFREREGGNRGYQTRINVALREYMRTHSAG